MAARGANAGTVIDPTARQRLGQVFTPVPVAELALSLALDGRRAAGRRPRLIDPACGDGVFLARAAERGCDVTGIDIDPSVVAAARARVPRARVTCGDFLAADPPRDADLYDAVVGNPPYVRQELLGESTKRRIVDRLRDDWIGDGERADRFGGRADLAAAFVARALRFVAPGGRVAFVVSAALIDAAYGEVIGPFIEGRGRLVAVVASPRERWFADAAVHGVIVVIERNARSVSDDPPRFVRLNIPVAAAARRVRGIEDLTHVGDVRTPSDAPGMRWGALLRAPQVWLDVVSAAAGAIVPLGSIAGVRRGVTSGANDFFYVARDRASATGIEDTFLVPLFKTPRHATSIEIDAKSLPTLAFVCDLDRTALAKHPGAARWIDRHGSLAARPTLAARPRWWSLAARPARLFLTKAYASRFVQHFATRAVVPDQRVYAIDAPPAHIEPLAAILNAGITSLALESLGRASLGEGALEWPVVDALTLPIIDPRRLRAPAALRALRAMSTRRIGPVFDEIDAPDRAALDDAVLAHLPALRDRARDIRAALADAVSERLTRVRSLLPR